MTAANRTPQTQRALAGLAVDGVSFVLGIAPPRHPIPSSSTFSSGVPHLRQITAPQSPQTRGSVTSIWQLGQ